MGRCGGTGNGRGPRPRWGARSTAWSGSAAGGSAWRRWGRTAGTPQRTGTGCSLAASVLKTAVLLAVLRRARQERRALTAPERAAAAAMIERSDNEAANTLWRAAGGAAGLAELLDRVGARHTEPEPSGRWGLSRTTANDQLALLRAVFTAGDPVLRPGERAWVRRLMCRVVPEQRWGVPAAGDGTGRPAVKNGWLPRTDTGLWVVHSVGRVTVAGHVHLLAVLSAGHRDFRPGITTVERGARAAVRALAS